MARKSKSSIPPFLKGKSLKSKKYSREDSMNLAKDAVVLNIDHSEEEGQETVTNAVNWLKENK